MVQRSMALRHEALLVALSVLAGTALACDRDREVARAQPTQPAPSSSNPPAAGPGTGLSSSPSGSASKQAPEGPRDERPSTSENMGRNFQGALQMHLRGPRVTRDMRFYARGNDARLQIDAGGGKPVFDGLLWADNISVLDHARRTYRTFALGSVKPEERDTSRVKLEHHDERVLIDGVPCERYELQDADWRIDACVSGLPGSFDVGKFQAVSGIEVPAWTRALLERRLLPLRASVRDTAGKEIYVLELAQYEPGPVDMALVTLPQDYHPEPGPAHGAPS